MTRLEIETDNTTFLASKDVQDAARELGLDLVDWQCASPMMSNHIYTPYMKYRVGRCETLEVSEAQDICFVEHHIQYTERPTSGWQEILVRFDANHEHYKKHN